MGILLYAFQSIIPSVHTVKRTPLHDVFIDNINIINSFESEDNKSVYSTL